MSSAYARRKSWVKRKCEEMTSEYNCNTCDFEPKTKDRHDPKYLLWKKCPYKEEENYHNLKEEVRITEGVFLFTSMCGCTSHSSIKEIVER
jgi:hypothetical protein